MKTKAKQKVAPRLELRETEKLKKLRAKVRRLSHELEERQELVNLFRTDHDTVSRAEARMRELAQVNARLDELNKENRYLQAQLNQAPHMRYSRFEEWYGVFMAHIAEMPKL